MISKRTRKSNFNNITNTSELKKKELTYDLTRSDSEMVYDNTKPYPNVNLPPLNPNNMTSEYNEPRIPLPTASPKNANDPKNDFITREDEPNKECFDITGCRYDFKNSPQNLTKYGPPLAQCGTYRDNNTSCIGTVFYPLNA